MLVPQQVNAEVYAPFFGHAGVAHHWKVLSGMGTCSGFAILGSRIFWIVQQSKSLNLQLTSNFIFTELNTLSLVVKHLLDHDVHVVVSKPLM